MSAANNRNRIRRVQEFNSRGRGRGHTARGGRSSHYRGGGRGGRYGRGGGRSNNRSHQSNRCNRSNARMVRCNDGTEMEVHPSYKFSDAEWNSLPEAERNRITLERANYKRQRNNDNTGGASVISEITTHNVPNDLQSIAQSVGVLQQQISSLSSTANNNDNIARNSNTPPPIMGGRNKQASLRSRRSNN